MPQKKKQHYVPKFLLKNFTNANDKFFVFQLLKNIVLDTPIPYQQQCYTDYMYGRDEQWESELSVLESDASIVIRKIINNEQFSNVEESVLKQFILFQHLRTEETIERTNSIMENGLRQLVQIIANFNKSNLSNEFAIAFAKEYLAKNFSRKESITVHLDAAKKNQSVLEDLRLVVLKTNGIFICSDNPVILENNLQPESGRGFASVGVFFILPISSEYAILLYDSKVYDISRNNLHIDLNQRDTFAINRTSFFYAQKTLFCREIEPLMYIKQYFDRIYIDKPLREIFYLLGIKDPILANLKISELKRENTSMIGASVPKMYAHYEPLRLSILTINSEFSPFINYINGNFSRYNKPEELKWKYISDNPTYWKVVKKYLS